MGHAIAMTAAVDEDLFAVVSRDGDVTNVRLKSHVRRLPAGVVITGFCNLQLAHNMEALPHDLVVNGIVFLKHLTFLGNRMMIAVRLPETVATAMVGRRVGDIINHKLLEGHPALDAIITGSEAVSAAVGEAPGTAITLDRAPFHHNGVG